MSEAWDFYMCRVEGQPASIFLDIGLAEDAPVRTLPVMAYVSVTMRSPRQDGLSSREEFETLKVIEDVLTEELQILRTSVYVGRCTCDGSRDFYFYLDRSETWEENVARVMQRHPEYEFEAAAMEDPEWKTYFNFLFPSEEDMERIQNRRTCEALAQQGEAFEQERPIEHWAYFPSERARAEFIEKAVALGCTVNGNLDPGPDQEAYGVHLSSIGIPAEGQIDEITLPLFRAARECGGAYDGWECQVLA